MTTTVFCYENYENLTKEHFVVQQKCQYVSQVESLFLIDFISRLFKKYF